MTHRANSREKQLRRLGRELAERGSSTPPTMRSPKEHDSTPAASVLPESQGAEEMQLQTVDSDIEAGLSMNTTPLSHQDPDVTIGSGPPDTPSDAMSLSADSNRSELDMPVSAYEVGSQNDLSWTQRLVSLARGTDAMQLLKHADTQQVIDELRFGAPSDPSDTGLLNRLTDNISAIRQDLLNTLDDQADDVSPKLRNSLVEGMDNIQTCLEGMKVDPPGASRNLAIAIVNLASAVLPMTVPLAVSPRQTLFAAEMSALIAKSMVEASAMISLPWVDKPVIADRWKARYLVNNLQALYFLVTVFKQKPAESAAYNLCGGIAAVVLLFSVFMSRELRDGAAFVKGTQPYADLQRAGNSLSHETKTALTGLLKRIRSEQSSLEEAKTQFAEKYDINPLLNKRLSLAIDTYTTLASKMASVLSEERAPRQDDPDRTAKLALAVVTGLITGVGAALIWPETIGVADLGSDAAFATGLQLSIAFDSTKSSADALDDFKTFSGFSVVLAMVLGANKFLGDPLVQNPHGPLVGALVMTALNLTVPGAAGQFAAYAVARAGSAAGEFGDLCWEIGNNMYSLLAAANPTSQT